MNVDGVLKEDDMNEVDYFAAVSKDGYLDVKKVHETLDTLICMVHDLSRDIELVKEFLIEQKTQAETKAET